MAKKDEYVVMTGEFRRVAERKGGGYVVSLRSNKSLHESVLGKPGTESYAAQVGYFIERPIYLSLCHDINGHVLPTLAQSLAMIWLGIAGRTIPEDLKYEEPAQNKRWDVMSDVDVAKNLQVVRAPGNTVALQVYVPGMKSPPKDYKQAPASHFPGYRTLLSGK